MVNSFYLKLTIYVVFFFPKMKDYSNIKSNMIYITNYEQAHSGGSLMFLDASLESMILK
jgi:hypothetical protein